MSKKANSKIISPISEIEIPHIIPETWIWKRLDECGTFISGYTPKQTTLSDSGVIPYFKVSDMNHESNQKYMRISSQFMADEPRNLKKVFLKGTIVYPKNGGAVFTNKKRILVYDSVVDLNTGGFLPSYELDTEYMYLYFLNIDFRKCHKGSTLPTLNQEKLRNYLVPVPPLEEQQRIVARIEELFSELDAAVATLERTKEQLAVYRQAVLKEAFDGVSGATDVVLGDLILEKPRNGYSPKGVDYETPFRNLTLTATTGGVFREGFFKYIDLDIDTESYLWVKHNDILIQRANTLEYVGTAVVYPGEDNRYVYPDLMMKCHLKEGINPYFIVHQLQSYKTRLYYQKNATGTSGSMPKINQKTVSNTPLIITDINTQEKIVSEIESRLSVCDKIEETVTTALQEAEAMRQSILKQAFAGEL